MTSPNLWFIFCDLRLSSASIALFSQTQSLLPQGGAVFRPLYDSGTIIGDFGMKWRIAPAGLMAALICASPANAQKTKVPVTKPALTYADVADMAIAADQVSAVRIRQAMRLKGQDALTVLPGRRRFLITAEVLALIRSKEAMPPRITYVVDVPAEASGKFPKLTKGEWILFSKPVRGYPTEVRLVSPDAQMMATPDVLSQVRTILKEAGAPDARPIVTGVTSAFHVAGTVEGEGETQIFLDTADDRPVSVTILRAGGAAPRWSIALGDVVDQGSGPPQRDTLIWYRLACFLPATLPAAAVADLETTDAAVAGEDYKVVMAGLGPCPRQATVKP